MTPTAATNSKPRPAVFLDRDGVLNEPPEPGGYILRAEDLKLVLGAARAVARLRRAGFFLSVATNQRCVGTGLLSVEGLEAIHARLADLLRAGDSTAALDAIYYCPDDRNSGSLMRKPAPGMLLKAAEEHGLDLAASWMIGDSAKDVGAALAAGVRPILIEHPGSAETRGTLAPDVAARTTVVANINEAVNLILTGRPQNAAFLA